MSNKRIILLENVKTLIEKQVTALTTPHDVDLSVSEQTIEEHDVDARQIAQAFDLIISHGPTMALKLAIDLYDDLDESLLDKDPEDVISELDNVIQQMEDTDADA